jgi:predicted MFS family arabinose efflux permease
LTLAVWILAVVPDFEGEARADRPSLGQVFKIPGVLPVLMVTLCFVLAHNILYTYIAPLLNQLHLIGQTDRVLLAFGGAILAGILLIGFLIDRWLRPLIIASITLFLLSSVTLGWAENWPVLIFGAVMVWGLAFGGAATLFQTASAHAAGASADVAQAMIVTVWNIAIAGGALVGGAMLALDLPCNLADRSGRVSVGAVVDA